MALLRDAELATTAHSVHLESARVDFVFHCSFLGEAISSNPRDSCVVGADRLEDCRHASDKVRTNVEVIHEEGTGEGFDRIGVRLVLRGC
jgi:hypothetical protein